MTGATKFMYFWINYKTKKDKVYKWKHKSHFIQ